MTTAAKPSTPSPPHCPACGATLKGWRLVGLNDLFYMEPSQFDERSANAPLYVGASFAPLGLTVCPQCGHADLWALAALEHLPRDAVPRRYVGEGDND